MKTVIEAIEVRLVSSLFAIEMLLLCNCICIETVTV